MLGKLGKICIPIRDHAKGGMYTFLRYWREYLDEQGITQTDDPTGDFDILFVNSFMVPFELVLDVKRRLPRVRVVQRVDGAAADYGRRAQDDVEQARVSMLADLVVFQSRYGKFATRRKFRVVTRSGPVIYNPVDIAMFRPDGPRLELPPGVRLAFVTYSTNQAKGLNEFLAVARANPDIRFVVAGRCEDLPCLGNLTFLGQVDHLRVADLLRSCDAFVFWGRNETCPNVVLEAMASGLPVMYLDSGGTAELVADGGLPMTVPSFSAQLRVVLRERKRIGERARLRAETMFSPGHIFSRYAEEIRSCVRRPVPSRGSFLWTACLGYPVLDYSRRDLPTLLLRRLLRMRRGGLARKPE